jgi:hypothetical protein
MTLACGGITLSHLIVEVTEDDRSMDPEARCSILVWPGHEVHFGDVQVRGTVIGLDGEDGEWGYPRAIRLGTLPYGREHRFRLTVRVPLPCRVRSWVETLRVEPNVLEPGETKLQLVVPSNPEPVVVTGWIVLETLRFIRPIAVSGHFTESPSTSQPTTRSLKVLQDGFAVPARHPQVKGEAGRTV